MTYSDVLAIGAGVLAFIFIWVCGEIAIDVVYRKPKSRRPRPHSAGWDRNYAVRNRLGED